MKFGLVAGESSGDLLGAGLIAELRARVPNARFEGVAGPAMIDAGCESWEHAEALAVMGLIEPLKHLPRLLRLRSMLAQRWTADPPDVFIGIDAPDFNLGLESRLRQAGVRTAHYVSPTVWAWRQGRVRTIRKAADLVLCIFPFEQDFFDEHDVNAVFVGHPRADSVPADIDVTGARQALGISPGTKVVAVLPGSRRSEVSRLGPIFVAAIDRIRASSAETTFVIPAASGVLREMVQAQLDAAGITAAVQLLDGQSERAMTAADVVMLASGTASLEAALLQKPMVAAYKLAPTTATIIKTFGLLKVDRVTMPNLITGERLVPEFIQDDATPEAIADAVLALLRDEDRRHLIADRFATLRKRLALDANARAADAVLELARS